MADKDLIQKATEYDKQSAKWKARRPFESLRQTHIIQPKYDGCHMLIDTSARRAFSRTNETVRSVDHIVDYVVAQVGPGWVVQGEAYIPGEPFPYISGKFRQHADCGEMRFVAYDMLREENFAGGRDNRLYADRLEDVQYHFGEGLDELRHAPVCSTVWAYARDVQDIQKYANDLVALGGYDGAILRDPHMPWVAGPSREGELIKVKPTISLDLRVVGWQSKPGTKTGRDVVTFTVEYRDAETNVGSGVPHDITPDNAHRYLGQIVEVECMAVNPNNTLREPRFKGVRYDKTKPDE